MNNRPGTLIIRPICGKLIRDTDFLTKMDPYCVVTCGSQRQKTRIASGAGKTPNWSDQLVFKKNYEDMVTVSVWDYDGNSKDDLIGEGSVSISRMTSTPNWEEWIDIVYKGRKSGEVRLSATFTPDPNAAGGYSQAPGMAPPTTIVYMNYPGQPSPYPAYPPAPSGYGTVPAQPPPSYPAYPPSYPAYPPTPVGYPPAPGYSTVPQSAPGYSTVPQPPPGNYPGYPPSGYPPNQGGYPPAYPGQYPPSYQGYPPSY